MPSECQIALIKIRPNILSDLIWVQTDCSDCQKKTLTVKEYMADISKMALLARMHVHTQACMHANFIVIY